MNETYFHKYFSNEGYRFLEVHVRDLIKVYHKTTTYPTKIQGIFGVRNDKFVLRIQSGEELLGRIKFGMMMLGVQEMSVGGHTFRLE